MQGRSFRGGFRSSAGVVVEIEVEVEVGHASERRLRCLGGARYRLTRTRTRTPSRLGAAAQPRSHASRTHHLPDAHPTETPA